MANRFIGLIEGGRIGDEAALKRAFRALAKRAHPDSLAGASRFEANPEAAERASRAFALLRAEYEEALRFLALGKPDAEKEPPAPAGGTAAKGAAPNHKPLAYEWDRGAFYASLEELLARGFPKRPSLAGPARFYDASRAAVLAYLAGRDLLRPLGGLRAAFLDFEAGYAALPSTGGFLGAGAEVRRLLYFFLSNVLGYHRLAFAHLEKIARSLMTRVEEGCRTGGQERALPFLRFLLEDLAEGPAMPE